MQTYYAIVDVEGKRLGTYVLAESISAAFEAAAARYKTRNPLLQVQTIAVQEIADEYVDRPLSAARSSPDTTQV